MSAAMAGMGGFCKGFFSEVPIPREATLVNIKLGIFYWCLMVIAGVAAIASISVQIYEEQPASRMDVEGWYEFGNYSGSNVKHCTNVDDFEYRYSSKWNYKPTKCKRLPDGEDMQVETSGMYFMTLVQDSVARTETDPSVCASLDTNCTAAGGSFTPYSSDSGCVCTSYEEFFIRNAEKTTIKLRHSYKVSDDAYSDSSESGSSGNRFIFTGPLGKKKKIEQRMLTRVLKPDGKPCYLKNGRYEFMSGEGDIGGTLEEFLACGDLDLDATSTKTMSKDPAESGPPSLRVTGAKITLEMLYSNRSPDVPRDVKTLCVVTVHVKPVWNSRPSTDHALGKHSNNLFGRPKQHRYRYPYGITVHFVKGSSFSFFNPNAVLSGIVNTIVLFSVPVALTRIMACHAIGMVSQIYRKFLRMPFNVFDEILQVSMTLMVNAVGFRMLTKQLDTSNPEVEDMAYNDVQEKMFEAFACHLGKNSPIDQDEMRACAKVVCAGLDVHGSVGVAQDEFVHACCSNISGNSRLFVKFFDGSRKLWLNEKILDNTRHEIKRVAKDTKEMLANIERRREMKESEDKKEQRAVGEEEVLIGMGAVGGAAVVGAAVGTETGQEHLRHMGSSDEATRNDNVLTTTMGFIADAIQ